MGASFLERQSHAGEEEAPPNILWLTCEDIGPHLGCFGHADATTPNLDRLAAEGARYINAFSVSGVCAP
ncbi:MAG TPA: sulfatase-like hydrolase/transferase, partial [Candidatus Hydrogenedentes bacterium]|nr:sulfatase-like hydrolase/transferase [Candidatus Hydrogenedentota bacterium]